MNVSVTPWHKTTRNKYTQVSVPIKWNVNVLQSSNEITDKKFVQFNIQISDFRILVPYIAFQWKNLHIRDFFVKLIFKYHLFEIKIQFWSMFTKKEPVLNIKGN